MEARKLCPPEIVSAISCQKKKNTSLFKITTSSHKLNYSLQKEAAIPVGDRKGVKY